MHTFTHQGEGRLTQGHLDSQLGGAGDRNQQPSGYQPTYLFLFLYYLYFLSHMPPW